ncbi:MAG: TIM barrel protein [Candidatus Aenigmatarchaeota archaeon]
MIWLGPAGIPTVCKERNTLLGIKTVSELGLNAMEIEFVRGVKMNLEIAKQAGEIAKEINVKLSVHAPYFINLCSQEAQKIENSKRMIIDSLERAEAMNADIVVFHPGFYGKLSTQEALEKVKKECEDLNDKIKSMEIKGVKLGLETTGKQSTFGTLEEIIQISRNVKNCVPVIDFAHIFARQGGIIDYSKIFDSLKPLKLKHLHTHFTCVQFSSVGIGRGNERYHLELKVKKPDFEPLAREIVRRDLDITIISEI